jgi:hypothetical protein
MSISTIAGLGTTSNLSALAATNIVMQQDTDGDDALSLEELNLSEDSFINLDINEDDLLSSDEIYNSVSSQLLELSKGDITQDSFNEFISSLGVETTTDMEDVLSSDYMSEATSAMLEALFEESDSDDMGLSQFSYFMSVVNSQTQDALTADQLDTYISNLNI